MVAAFQTHFAAQNDHYAQQGSSNNSLPISRGQIGFFFYMKGVHNASLKRETVCTPAELSGEELCYHFTAKSERVFRADLSPALPLVSARIEAHLFVLYFLMFKLALPS